MVYHLPYLNSNGCLIYLIYLGVYPIFRHTAVSLYPTQAQVSMTMSQPVVLPVFVAGAIVDLHHREWNCSWPFQEVSWVANTQTLEQTHGMMRQSCHLVHGFNAKVASGRWKGAQESNLNKLWDVGLTAACHHSSGLFHEGKSAGEQPRVEPEERLTFP